MRSREERSQFFDTNIGPGSALLAEENDLFINDSHYDKVMFVENKIKQQNNISLGFYTSQKRSNASFILPVCPLMNFHQD